MNGKRMGTARKGGRYLAARARRGKTAPVRERGMFRLVICGAVFVLIVAVKLLFPQAVADLAQHVSSFLGQDMDFREAFAAVGRAVSGEETAEDSLQEVFAAVFQPSGVSMSDEETTGAHPSVAVRPGEALAKRTVAQFPAEREAKSVQEELPEKEGTEEQTLTSTVVYMMPSLPENASLELRNLGFRYTTPVRGKLTSTFGWRDHPTAGGTRFHYGIDLAADTGTEIVAFADGEVFAAGESSTLGKYIILQHAGGYKTLYAHCSAVTVLSGSVSMGQVIARIGESGTATGPHLHFELQNGAVYFNPIYYVSIG